MFVVDCKGRSGGLLLLWNSDSHLEIQNFSRRHINGVFLNQNKEPIWKLTCFYGHPDVRKRVEAWNLLRHLSQLDPIPWMCIGDFNEILESLETSSNSIRPRSQMQAFQNTLGDCNLADLGFRGPKFTWWNGRHGANFTRERLDRAVANPAWTRMFDAAEVEVLDNSVSDHHPLLVSVSHSDAIKWKKYHFFRYEASWTRKQEHGEIIKKAWRVKQRVSDPWKMIHRKLNG
jgi:hypothetical protein